MVKQLSQGHKTQSERKEPSLEAVFLTTTHYPPGAAQRLPVNSYSKPLETHWSSSS